MTGSRTQIYGFVFGRHFAGVAISSDRIGRHFTLKAGRILHIAVVIHPAMWAGSFYLLRRRIWLRPINYQVVSKWQSPS